MIIPDDVMALKNRIFIIINKGGKHDLLSKIYDWYMLAMIILSIAPLMFLREYHLFAVTEIITVVAFIIDYLLRWYISPLKLKQGWLSYH